MMPHTVPKSPMKGAVAPIVASTPVPRVILRPTPASMRSSREATRSLIPSGEPADSAVSRAAASTRAFAGPPPRAQAASARDRALSTVANACRNLRPSASSSIAFASPTVQVMTEAKARPMMTASTIWLADRNILHGDRSLGNVAAIRAKTLSRLILPDRRCGRRGHDQKKSCRQRTCRYLSHSAALPTVLA